MDQHLWRTSDDVRGMVEYALSHGEAHGQFVGSARQDIPLHPGRDWKPSLNRKMRLLASAMCRHFWSFYRNCQRRCIIVGELLADGLVNNETLYDAFRDEEKFRTSGKKVGPGKYLVTLLHAAHPNDTWGGDFCIRQTLDQALFILGGKQSPAPLACLARDIIGDLWYETPFHRSWLTPDVLHMARVAYEERIPDLFCPYCNGLADCDCTHCEGKPTAGWLDSTHLCLLADALEDAGCPTYCVVCRALVAEQQRNNVEPCIIPDMWPAFCLVCNCTGQNPLLAHLRQPGIHARGCWAVDEVYRRGLVHGLIKAFACRAFQGGLCDE